ncbi:MAG TPA: ABC transporter permease [Phycisphaerales bacterium]|nr:ABC transporter permease [Phycisphaerales bacterium]HMP36483.1 ABC transporter permease [Phycisphaerales bacterium]
MRLLPIEYAIRNLGRTPSRLVLSIVGAALVVLLLLVAVGFVRGMDRALRMAGGAENVILLGAGSEESVERSEIASATPGVLAASVPGIRTRAGVAYISPQVHAMLPARVGAESPPGASARQVMVRGVTPEASLVHGSVGIVDGRWPRPGFDEVLLGRRCATVLGVPERSLDVGESLVMDGRAWTIAGRFAAPGTVFEAEVWMPLEDLKAATRRDSISCIIVTLDPFDESTGEGAELDDIAAFAKMRPDLELVAMAEQAYYGKLADFFAPIRIVAWVTASLIALGGVIGGLNTTYAAFATRIREFGTLQCIGYRRPAIALSMVQESALAGAAGGLLACGVGALVLDGLAVRFSMGAFGLVIDAPVIGIGLLCGLVLGVVGALPPAVRCLRPPIASALKGH